MTASGLYLGMVTHRRMRPKGHFLKYRVFQILLDLDEAQQLAEESRLFGFNGPGLLSFHETDHGDGSDTPLKTQVEAMAREAGLAFGGPVLALAMPRVLGFVFNPITLYFVHDSRGLLSAVVHEVNNTVGGRHFYALPAGAGAVIEQAADKAMYVSPFMDMDYLYRFRLTPPGETFEVAIHMMRGEELWLTAGFAGRRRPFEDRELFLAWIRHPLVTLKVVAGIHFEALRLWLKGIGYRPPPDPKETTQVTT